MNRGLRAAVLILRVFYVGISYCADAMTRSGNTGANGAQDAALTADVAPETPYIKLAT